MNTQTTVASVPDTTPGTTESHSRLNTTMVALAITLTGGLAWFTPGLAAQPQVHLAAAVTSTVPPAAYCKSGYVWRDARNGDGVCVTPAERDQVHAQNAAAASNRNPGGGDYGPLTCKSYYVWRDAFNGDGVCVTPAERDLAHQQNAPGPSHTGTVLAVPSGPDLTVSFGEGGQIIVKNIGKFNAPSSTAAVFFNNGKSQHRHGVPALAPEGSTNWRDDASTADCSVTKVDVDDQIVEANEQNNSGSGGICLH
jgi:hypothetical protein